MNFHDSLLVREFNTGFCQIKLVRAQNQTVIRPQTEGVSVCAHVYVCVCVFPRENVTRETAPRKSIYRRVTRV